MGVRSLIPFKTAHEQKAHNKTRNEEHSGRGHGQQTSSLRRRKMVEEGGGGRLQQKAASIEKSRLCN